MSTDSFESEDLAAVVLARTRASKAERRNDTERRGKPSDIDEIQIAGGPPWPKLDSAALYGLPGEVVRTILPHTEADAAALLVSFLTAFGSSVGPGPHVIADGAQHFARLFIVLVGRTSRARKGTSWRHIRNLMRIADFEWAESRVFGGLSSGEGLIAAVGDGEENRDGESIGAVLDKRLLVIEEEFSRVLIVKGRETNTLSAIVRQAWDTGDIRTMTKHPLTATGAHISLVGHITVEELCRSLTDTDRCNGFANRFLFVAVQRSKVLPNGGNLVDAEIGALGQKVAIALTGARKIERVRRSPDADERWDVLYRQLVEDDSGGLVGAITDRAEAQVLRLSLLYALLDCSRVIEIPHLNAAEAVWRYCGDSVHHIFGDKLGDPIADKLLAGIRGAGPEGLDGTEQRDLFARHVPGEVLDAARKLLERLRLIVTNNHETGGRTRIVSVATKATKATKGGLWSPKSLSSQDAFPNPAGEISNLTDEETTWTA